MRTWALTARDAAAEASAASIPGAVTGSSHDFQSAGTGHNRQDPSGRDCPLRWRKVAGTVGAVVNFLADLCWKAPSPFGLASPSGATFRLDAAAFDDCAGTPALMADLLDELGQSVYNMW